MRAGRNRQGGWVGLIVMLLALAIVAWVAKDALKGYGLMGSGKTVPTSGGSAAERARAPAAIDTGGAGVDTTVPTPSNAMERARAVEGMLKSQEAKRAGGNWYAAKASWGLRTFSRARDAAACNFHHPSFPRRREPGIVRPPRCPVESAPLGHPGLRGDRRLSVVLQVGTSPEPHS